MPMVSLLRRHLSYTTACQYFCTISILPVVSLIQKVTKSEECVFQLIGRYGNIFSVQFGNLTFVVVNGYQLVKEALVHQAEVFADRPHIPLLQFSPRSDCAVSNIICSITFGERFEYHDSQFQELLHLLAETLLLIGNFWGQVKLLYNAFPWLMRWVPGPHNKIFKHWKKLKYFVNGVIAKHKEDWNSSETRDFIDCYLKEIEKSKDDSISYFNEENLLCSTLDLFLTGTETSATTIRWALLYMAVYPKIQEKVQTEIDTVIGQSRQPMMDDKENMPYTNAVLNEVQRMGNVVPINVPRMATSDTTLAGFHLPKGTTLIPSLTSIMFDKNVWETPDTFNPEHFLENGQFRKREAFLPFSAGKRVCPGEHLARTELFIFFTTLIQKFTFRAPENVELNFEFTISLTRCPKPFQICAVSRC
uniref:Cytochrome P450 2J2-like n=1 Tax=Terrapene triunguis TaxID=2587831 RepID=A0A674KFJ1_9SAUR